MVNNRELGKFGKLGFACSHVRSFGMCGTPGGNIHQGMLQGPRAGTESLQPPLAWNFTSAERDTWECSTMEYSPRMAAAPRGTSGCLFPAGTEGTAGTPSPVMKGGIRAHARS